MFLGHRFHSYRPVWDALSQCNPCLSDAHIVLPVTNLGKFLSHSPTWSSKWGAFVFFHYKFSAGGMCSIELCGIKCFMAILAAHTAPSIRPCLNLSRFQKTSKRFSKVPEGRMTLCKPNQITALKLKVKYELLLQLEEKKKSPGKLFESKRLPNHPETYNHFLDFLPLNYLTSNFGDV